MLAILGIVPSGTASDLPGVSAFTRRLLTHLSDPRALLIAGATLIEGVALALWPTVFLIDGSDGSTRLGTMFIQRYAPLGPVVRALKSLVDWTFPGALWSWEALGSFLFAGAIAAFVAYAAAAWALTRGTVSLRWIVVPLLVFQVTLILVPASMTTDIYNYAIYGEMPVLYDANPFIRTPSEFPQSPLFYLIPLYWHDAPSVYGPLWVALSAGVAAIFRGGPLADELLFYRLIANVAHTVNTLLVWSIARRLHPRRAPSAALAYGWNPLLLVDFALNGHNDVAMLTGLLTSALLLGAGRAYRGAAGLGLSIATKYTSVLVAPLLLVWSARRQPGWKSQACCFLVSGGIVALLLVALYSPWIDGIGTFGPVLYWASGPRLNNFWPEPLLITATSWASGLLGVGYDDAWEPILAGFKLLAKVALCGYILYAAWTTRHLEDVLASSARVFLLFLLLVNTWVMPWYYSWPLAVCAALGWQSTIVRLCAGFTFTAFLLMYQRQYGQSFVADWGGLTLVLPIVILATPSLIRTIRSRILARSTVTLEPFSRNPALDAPTPATSTPIVVDEIQTAR